ncbi:non-ribosomal peptide synthetase [Streptomyces pinistramenti]|uniref:non-ribosomal peptide synthetase n=1 Tax=Streptomyces pinistramenti TaxID=2884812 RepID=UPI001D066309|nr:non-ribosomal peptide synthetase [Streptomyces pinistramenti]MCB5910453.1 amino acid adenylation domain-containing protein [Streptomyces pinistramenti]
MEDLLSELHNRRIDLRQAKGRVTAHAADGGALPPQLAEAVAGRQEELAAALAGRPRPAGLPALTAHSAARNEPFALTDIQQAYVIGRHKGLELGGVASHHYLEFACPALDVPRLQTALRQVIARHEMLRAHTTADGTQRILPAGHLTPYEIAVTDLRGKPAPEQDEALAAIRTELTDQMLPTDQAPPFDIRITHLTQDSLRLHASIDLLFIDMHSVFRIFADWRRFYDDPAWTPAPLDLSFRDYVLAHQDLPRHDLGTQAAAYWQGRLATLPPAPELPLASAPEQLGRPAFERRRTTLAPDRSTALQQAAERHGLTLTALLLAAYAEVLRTWSKRQEFTLTLTQFHRLPLHPQVDEIAGDFLTPALLAITGTASQTFAQRAAGMQRQWLADLAHSTHSGITVLRELARRQDSGRTAMPVVFSSTLTDPRLPSGAALEGFGTLVDALSQTPQVWLENQISHSAGGSLTLHWNAVKDLFPDGVLDAMFDAYGALLTRLTDDEDTWQNTGSVVPLSAGQAAERDRANATADAQLPAARLHDLVNAAATRSPDAVAVIAAGTETTYRQLTQRAHRLAHRLRAEGAGTPNTLVAVSMRPGADQYAALLGILHAGAAYVAIDPDLPAERRHRLIERCAATLVVTDADQHQSLTWPAGTRPLTLHEDATTAHPATAPHTRQGVDDLAYVIFTSGSTGEPKGVMITHRSAANTVQDINRRFHVGPDDRVMALAPTGFDLSVYDLFGVLGAGGTVIVPDPAHATDPAHWTQLISRYGVTLWNSVPAPMRMWTESLTSTGAPRGCRLRLALLSGDWIPIGLPDQIRAHLPAMQVISLGGATEGSIWSIHHPIETVDPTWTSIPYGTPLANQTMHVHNSWLAPSPVHVTGEIYIGGTGVAQGYLGDEQRTAERFLTHPHTGERLYKTGDLGRYLPGGTIEILGREDFQVKINGYRVELGEIEAALVRQPGIRTALVTAPLHARTGQRQLAAYLVADDPDRLPDPAQLREALAQVLPSYMLPARFVPLTTFPLTPNGKIDQKALPTPWNDTEPTPGTRAAPRTETEEKLLALWAQQLGHQDFGTEEGFFDVGGDSLHAVGILGLLRAEFGIGPQAEGDIIEGLFMNATITAFAELITQHTPTGQTAPTGQITEEATA